MDSSLPGELDYQLNTVLRAANPQEFSIEKYYIIKQNYQKLFPKSRVNLQLIGKITNKMDLTCILMNSVIKIFNFTNSHLSHYFRDFFKKNI